MISVRNSLSDSIRGMLGLKVAAPTPEAVQAVREAMLALLGEHGEACFPQLHTRLHQIHDAQGLWHARVDLYTHLCEHFNELYARDRLATLTPLFKGLIPRALLESAGLRAGPGRSGLDR